VSQTPALLPREPLLTERLRLEPMRAELAAATLEVVMASRVEFARWFLWAGKPSLEETQRYAAESEQQWEDGSAYRFAIFIEDQLVGDIAIRGHRLFRQQASVGYWMGTGWSGKGYMSEAARAVRDLGFDRAGFVRMELAAGVQNLGSQRVAEKIGMRREGLMRSAAWDAAEQPYDAYLYAMLADDPRRDTGERYAGDRDEPEISEPDFSRGLVTVVAQAEGDGQVLMVAHMNAEAYRMTLETGHAWFWSRSRERLWEKGETSGDYLDVRSVTIDCDGDAVLLEVSPHGPACHTGARTCFHNPVK
jgi:phosphoribosyl-AMP cyclohydrolase